ncbi:ALP1-like protein [Tanacetum coccineum]|uniref:ALP1-like protein n=1 Tax=Tanacetum coccineum TaxID=301880 RepID=A0ABQ5ITP7_9ASTR
MGATTARKSLQMFCKVIMSLYGEEFLCKPTYTDTEKLYARHDEKHGLPGMLRSIDYTHWPWANCLLKWKLIKYPTRGMSRSRLSDVMYTCIILHNMIIHDNGNAISPDFFLKEQHRDDDPVRTNEESMQVTQEIVDRRAHLSLKCGQGGNARRNKNGYHHNTMMSQ